MIAPLLRRPPVRPPRLLARSPLMAATLRLGNPRSGCPYDSDTATRTRSIARTAGTCEGRAVRPPNRLALRNIASSSLRSQARGTEVPGVAADSRRPAGICIEARDNLKSHSSCRCQAPPESPRADDNRCVGGFYFIEAATSRIGWRICCGFHVFFDRG